MENNKPDTVERVSQAIERTFRFVEMVAIIALLKAVIGPTFPEGALFYSLSAGCGATVYIMIPLLRFLARFLDGFRTDTGKPEGSAFGALIVGVIMFGAMVATMATIIWLSDLIAARL